MKSLLCAAALALMPVASYAASFTDIYGQPVTDRGDGTYTRGGVTLRASSDIGALVMFNALPPSFALPYTTSVKLISGLDLWNRLTNAEQTAVINKGTAYILVTFGIVGTPIVDVTDAGIVANFNTLVSQAILTGARRTQILNLAVPSP